MSTTLQTASKKPKPALPKRRRRRFQKELKPVVGLTEMQAQKLIDSSLARAHRTIDFGPIGRDFVEAVCNPVGTGLAQPIVQDYPNGGVANRYTLQETGAYSFSPGATTSAWLQMVGPAIVAGTPDQTFQITSGVDCADASLTCTAVTEVFASNSASLGYNLTGNHLYRPISGYIRIAPCTDETKMTAVFRGFQAQRCLRSAAATWASNGGVMSSGFTDGKVWSAKDGITVRYSPIGEAAFDFRGPQSYCYEADNMLKAGHMPLILATSLQDTTYNVSWCMRYSVLAAEGTSIVAHPPSFEPEYPALRNVIAKMPFTAAGNSFKSFLKTAIKSAHGIFSIATDVLAATSKFF